MIKAYIYIYIQWDVHPVAFICHNQYNGAQRNKINISSASFNLIIFLEKLKIKLFSILLIYLLLNLVNVQVAKTI